MNPRKGAAREFAFIALLVSYRDERHVVVFR
jgi:hypothetical protein